MASKSAEISTIKGAALEKPLTFSYSWEVPTVDELVNLLSDEESAKKVLAEIGTARETASYATARAKCLSENEPAEVKVERFVKHALKMGMDEKAARQFAASQFS